MPTKTNASSIIKKPNIFQLGFFYEVTPVISLQAYCL